MDWFIFLSCFRHRTCFSLFSRWDSCLRTRCFLPCHHLPSRSDMTGKTRFHFLPIFSSRTMSNSVSKCHHARIDWYKRFAMFFFCVFFPLSFYSAALPSFRSYLVYRPALYAARCAQIRSWDDQIYLLVIAAVGQEDGIDQPRIRNWPFSCMTDCRQAPTSWSVRGR